MMPNSPRNCESNTQKRNCDFCGESVALVYCRADSAKLCLCCDRQVHSTNQLFTKHTRFHLCDNCDSSPASIFCCTHNSVLCQNCDYELHTQIGGSASNHDRRALEGFTGCPSVVELSGVLGFQDFDAKSLSLRDEESDKGFNGVSYNGGLYEENDGFSDLFVWDVPTMVNLDDLIVSTDRSHSFQAMVVPPLPKDRNLSCGQYKHEMFHQLHELGKSEPDILHDANSLAGNCFMANDDKDFGVQHMIGAYQHDEEHPAVEGNEASPYIWNKETGDAVNDIFLSSALSGSHIEECGLNSDTHSGMSSANLATNGSNSQYLISTESPGFSQKVSTRELCSADRGFAISRYKEKKRTRRFQKHIRYESRKVQAENRTRVKGRFAKVNNCKNQTNQTETRNVM